MSRLDPPRVDRRSFLSLAALGSFFAALGTAAAGMLRLPSPAVLPGPVRRFKLGPPEQFAAGSETAFAEENLLLFRDDEGVYAISSTCTHSGLHRGADERWVLLSLPRLTLRQPRRRGWRAGSASAALAGGQPRSQWRPDR